MKKTLLFVALIAVGASLVDWFSEGPPDGPYERYYENGQLREKVTYAAGERDGPYERYGEDGQLYEKGIYDMGVKCGEWIEPGLLWGQNTVTHDPCPPDLEGGN
jgi:hypothetical protein